MDIKTIAKNIRGAIEGKLKISFFVGAGISVRSDLDEKLCLDFKELNEKVMQYIAGGNKELENYLK